MTSRQRRYIQFKLLGVIERCKERKERLRQRRAKWTTERSDLNAKRSSS